MRLPQTGPEASKPSANFRFQRVSVSGSGKLSQLSTAYFSRSSLVPLQRFNVSTLQRLYSVDSHLPHRCLAAFPAMSLVPVAPFNVSTVHVIKAKCLDATHFPRVFLAIRSM